MKRNLALFLGLALMLCGIAAHAQATDPTFEQLSRMEWTFSSGVGGWSTEMKISGDGSFTGNYHDSEMGETGDDYPYGTVYVSSFSGQMSLLGQADELAWRVQIDKLTPDEAPGQESIDDGVRYVTDDPYGLTEGDEMLLYLPGTPLDAFTEDMRMWAHLMDQENPSASLESWFLYSRKNETGFVGYPVENEVSIANPWKDMTAEELKQVSGLSFGVPEGAKDVIYRWLESDKLAEMQFKLDNDEYCARVQPAELSDGELMNISGMYFAWDNEEPITVGQCYGTIGQAQTGTEDWVELCLWYDANAKRMYSLSVSTTELDGLDLTAVAQMVYRPAE